MPARGEAAVVIYSARPSRIDRLSRSTTARSSALERAEQIAEWVRLTEGRRAEERVSVQIAQKVKTGRPEGGISAASRALGVTRDEVQRAVKRGAIVPEVKEAIRGNPTIADSGVELDALASMPAEEQQAAVAAVKGGKAATVREAAAKICARIAAENPDAPRRARGTPPPQRSPDSGRPDHGAGQRSVGGGFRPPESAISGILQG